MIFKGLKLLYHIYIIMAETISKEQKNVYDTANKYYDLLNKQKKNQQDN